MIFRPHLFVTVVPTRGTLKGSWDRRMFVSLPRLISICMDEDKPKRKRKQKETSGERKPRSAQQDALHAKNWKEYMATVEDIQNFLMDRILLRHNVITGRVEYRLPDSMPPKFFAEQIAKAERGGLWQTWQPLCDRIVNSLWAELSATTVGAGITQKLSSVLLGRAFMELGFERRTCRNVRGYIVVRRSAEEMRSLRSVMAQESSEPTSAPDANTDTDDTVIF